MAQFIWSRAAPFLVLALACLSGMCCAATTAGPKTTAAHTTVKETTEAPTTAPLTTINETTTAPATTSNGTTAAPTTMSTSNITTAATNTTTAPSNMTTAPSNMTTAPSNMTTAPSNMTTAPSNMTTTTSNMTTAPSNMTTAPSNMTTTTSNMTTAPSNMTTAPSNMTTAPSNMTTTTSNMTTAPSNMSTTQPVTTAAPEPTWKVTDKNGKLCMQMSFDGTIIYKNVTHQIPPSASVAKSSCDSATFSRFVVEFSDGDFNLWQLVLNFTMTKGSFKLRKLMLNLYYQSGYVTGSEEKNFFEVPVGDYYKCDSLNMTASPFMVNLTKPVLQPFAQKTKDGDLGKEYVCGTTSANHTNIIIGVVIAVIVLAAAVGVTYYVVKRRGKSADPPYARVQ